jgi:DNA topoisomerase-3
MPVAVAEDTELIIKMESQNAAGEVPVNITEDATNESPDKAIAGAPEETTAEGSIEAPMVISAEEPTERSEKPASEKKDLEGYFMAKGKVQLVEGWKKIEGIDSKDTLLPNVSEGDVAELKKTEVKEVERKPPKPHTEKTLLKVMETCGKKFEEKDDQDMMMAILSGFSIGTPATRAETIKKLKTAGYIKAKGKSLTCTDLGKQLVETFPARELFDLEYTGRLEKTLSDIEKKKYTRQEFLDLITEFVKTSVDKIKNDSVFGGSKDSPPLHTEPVGICPECGSPVMESDKAFGCSNWRNGCHYAVWKNDYFIQSLGKKVTYEMVKILLEHGKVGFHGCVSKKGNKFSAYFYYEKDPATGKYKWRLEFL